MMFPNRKEDSPSLIWQLPHFFAGAQKTDSSVSSNEASRKCNLKLKKNKIAKVKRTP